MAEEDKSAGALKHELANAEQQKRALQHLLQRASDEIDELVKSDCDDEGKAKAKAAAKRFRRASSL
jgi:predicted  nucleic acid-binding Zn-ribbon protein